MSKAWKKERKPYTIFAISIALLVLVIFAIASALITIYVDLDIIYFFGIPLDFRYFLFGIFTIAYGIFIFQMIRLSGILREKRKEKR